MRLPSKISALPSISLFNFSIKKPCCTSVQHGFFILPAGSDGALYPRALYPVEIFISKNDKNHVFACPSSCFSVAKAAIFALLEGESPSGRDIERKQL